MTFYCLSSLQNVDFFIRIIGIHKFIKPTHPDQLLDSSFANLNASPWLLVSKCLQFAYIFDEIGNTGLGIVAHSRWLKKVIVGEISCCCKVHCKPTILRDRFNFYRYNSDHSYFHSLLNCINLNSGVLSKQMGVLITQLWHLDK